MTAEDEPYTQTNAHYQITANDSVLSLHEKKDALDTSQHNRSTQERTNMVDEENPHQIFQQSDLNGVGLHKRVIGKDNQKRALISREVMKSDQPFMLVTDCTMVVEEEITEGESHRVEHHHAGNQFDAVKHVKLNEEEQ